MSRDNLICGLVIGWSAVVLLLLVVFGLPNTLGRGAALAVLFAIYLLDRHLRRRESEVALLERGRLEEVPREL